MELCVIFGVCIPIGFACVLLLSHFFVEFGRWLGKRKLLAAGRSVAWNDAIERVLGGNGFLIRNRTSLPGDLWWVSSKDDSLTLYHEVRDFGLIVVHCPSKQKDEVLSDPRLVGKVFTLKDIPFGGT